ENVLLDVAKIPDADRPYDPRNCRPPMKHDVVYAFAGDGTPVGHRRLANLDPGQRCVFQGLVYHVRPGPTPGTCTLAGYGEVYSPPAIRVGVEYTFPDAFGTGEVSYAFDPEQEFVLTDGRVLHADQMAAGMQFHLEDGTVATVTRVHPPGVWE